MTAHRASLWDRFFYSEGSTLALALFRIFTAVTLLREVEVTWKNSVFAIDGGFHLPYVSFFPHFTREVYDLLHTVQYPLLILVALGLFMRFSCGALLVAQGLVFFNDLLNFRNHPYLFMLIVLILMFSPADESLSVKALLRARKEKIPILTALLGPNCPFAFQRMMQLQVCLVYFLAGLQKLSSYFIEGHVMVYHLRSFAGYWRPFLEFFVGSEKAVEIQDKFLTPEAQFVPAIITVVMELVLPFAIWHRKTRKWAMLLGIGFHLAVGLLMNVWTFTGVMIASYLLFLEPDTIPRLFRRLGLGGKPAPAEGAG